jgi:hypothetical protein
MNKVDKTCVECKINKGSRSTYFNVYLCTDCRMNDKYTLITKTNAKKNYFLKDEDLDQIDKILGESSYGSATFFTKENIKNYICNKNNLSFDDFDNFITNLNNEKNMKLEIKKNKSDEKKKILMQKNKDELIKALSKYKLELRDDSVLCQNYINGNSEYSLEEIVRRMCEMKYLYEYCHMDECKEIAYKEYNASKKAGFYPVMSIFDHAEMMALEKYSRGKYPKVFPWLI